MTNRIFFVVAFVFLTGCQNPEGPKNYKIGDEVDLKLGERLLIPEAEIKIKFSDVVEDSRCPEGVTCVWAGNGKIELLFEKEELFLNTTLEPQKVNKAGLSIQLVALNPYPVYQREIVKEDYTIRLLITKN